MNPKKPIALYVHMPWCIKKCPYCDFNSHQINSSMPEEEYIDNLILDLKEDLLILDRDVEVTTIFFGGGTPSLITPSSYSRLLDEFHNLVSISNDCEVTMETNPGTTEHSDFNAYADAGINRISLGVQSFNDASLTKLGRIHSSVEPVKSIDKIKSSAIKELNIDIMHSLPGQDTEHAIYDLDRAISLSPTHISWYQLTLEPGTNFYNKPPKLPNSDTMDAIHSQGIKLLKENNYIQYEISAFSQNDSHKCRHNVNYWKYGDYLGIGAGAHGKITLDGSQKIIRTTKTRQPKFYMSKDKPFLADMKTIPQQEIPFEFMLNNLRLVDGFNKDDFEQSAMLPFEIIEPQIVEAVSKGLIERANDRYLPTKAGMLFYNDVIELFIN